MRRWSVPQATNVVMRNYLISRLGGEHKLNSALDAEAARIGTVAANAIVPLFVRVSMQEVKYTSSIASLSAPDGEDWEQTTNRR